MESTNKKKRLQIEKTWRMKPLRRLLLKKRRRELFLFEKWNMEYGDRMAEREASWTEDLMVGSSIPAATQGYLIFPAQKDECHQGAHP